MLKQPHDLIVVDRSHMILPTIISDLIDDFDERQLQAQERIDFLENRLHNLENKYDMVADAATKLPDYNYDRGIGEAASIVKAVEGAIDKLNYVV